MCGSMADIQSAAAEIRRGKKKKKKKKKKKNKPQHENIYGLPIPQGDHKKHKTLPSMPILKFIQLAIFFNIKCFQSLMWKNLRKLLINTDVQEPNKSCQRTKH